MENEKENKKSANNIEWFSPTNRSTNIAATPSLGTSFLPFGNLSNRQQYLKMPINQNTYKNGNSWQCIG